MMKRLSALEVRKRFGSVLDMVVSKRMPVAITRANKALVVMVPADDYDDRRAGQENRLRLAVEKIAAWKQRHAGQLRDVDAVRLVRESRRSR